MIIFENKGLIDKRSITTFGISSKENSSAIGYFGTGLKYATAILLREGLDITICIGNEKLTFETKKEAVRVDEFDFIYMNGERLGFTTELGKTWQLWQAFREIYCNCTDEHGAIYKDESFSPKEGVTIIAVDGVEFQRIFDNKRDIFIDSTPIYCGPRIDIHSGSSKFLFYKGVRVAELDRPTLYTYNFTGSLDLTEDRTIKDVSDIRIRLGELAITCTDKDILNNLCTANKDLFENKIDFDLWHVPSDEFMSVVGQLKNNFSSSLNSSALKKFGSHANHHFEPEESVLNHVQTMQLTRAIDFNKLIGFDVDSYPIVVTDFMGDGILGMAKDGKIYIAKQVFMMGTKYLASTLLEEFIHLRFRYADETREMQNFLFDALVTTGETFALKEPV